MPRTVGTVGTVYQDTESILEELQCPICLETCCPPIFLCVNGHKVCQHCRHTLHHCGICRAPGKPSNHCQSLDNLAALLRLPCRNQEFGCNRFLLLQELEAHHVECKFTGVAFCAVCVNWRGKNLKSFLEHLESFHRAFNLPANALGASNDIFKLGKIGIQDAIIRFSHFKFWFRLRYRPISNVMHCTVRVISYVEDAKSRFQFKIQLKQVDTDESLWSYTSNVSSLLDVIPEPKQTFSMPPGTVTDDASNVYITLQILKS